MSPVASWFRLFAGLAVVFALLTYVGPADMAEDIRIEAVHKVVRTERAKAYYRELLCDCLKQYRGRALRLQITHQPDMEMCTTTCWYDGAGPTKGTL
jgi:hypothetical protein